MKNNLYKSINLLIIYGGDNMEKSIYEDYVHTYNYCLDNFKNIQELIKFADQKASGLLVVNGFLITIFINFFSNSQFISIQEASTKDWVVLVLGLLFCVTMIGQIVYIVFKIIFPREASNYDNEINCIFYYEHVCKMKKTDFIELIKSEDIDKNINDIASQIYEVSKILNKKHENIRRAVILLIWSIIFLLGYVTLLKI